MPRGKRAGTRVRDQCRTAAKAIDRALLHLMAADVIAKGGTVYAKGKVLPAGVDLKNPEKDGHPKLNEWLPIIVPVLVSAKDSILRMVKIL